MKRFTFEGLFCDIAQCTGQPGNISECPGGYCDQRRTWERLKKYEDTGYTPEEIVQMAEELRKLKENARVVPVIRMREET